MDMSASDDDSDDGQEQLPFPKEIKIHEPESPPGEFILDPVTGKITGMKYLEKTVAENDLMHVPEEKPHLLRGGKSIPTTSGMPKSIVRMPRQQGSNLNIVLTSIGAMAVS